VEKKGGNQPSTNLIFGLRSTLPFALICICKKKKKKEGNSTKYLIAKKGNSIFFYKYN
jgi:hypothetical protein